MRYRLLSNDPPVRSFRRVLTVGTLMSLTGLWVLIVAGRGSSGAGLQISVFLVVWYLALMVLVTWSRRGEVSLDDGGFQLRRAFGRTQFHWSEVTSIDLKRVDEAGLAAKLTALLAGATNDEVLVEVRVAKRVLAGQTPGLHERQVVDVSTPTKTLRFFVKSPLDFVRDAQSFRRLGNQ